MSTLDPYLWAKALHVALVIVFVGGALAAALLLTAMRTFPAKAAPIATALRDWDQIVTVPAMMATWALGIGLAAAGGWFVSGWLHAKLVLVFILSGLHGAQSGRLRRAAAGGGVGLLRGDLVIIGCAAAIAVLAVLKPWA
jgi:uncharacterized membrane protein